MSLYSRARKHIDMKRVKEIREEKIKEQKISKLIERQLEIAAELKEIEREESKHCDWRKELDEGMTTAGLGVINLDGSPDAISSGVDDYNSSDSEISTLTGGRIQLGVPEGQSFVSNVQGNARTQLRKSYFDIDSSRIDTLVINMSGIGGGAPFWYDPNPRRESTVNYIIYKDSDPFGTLLSGAFSNGNNTISLPSSLRASDLIIYIYQYASNGEFSGGYNPPSYINSITTKRIKPMSLFVALDDPEANSFVRDGTADKMSPGEKRKKLEEMLSASEEYLNKMFGSGMPKGATVIADYEPQQSFMDIQAGGERITKQGGKTVTDTTRGIKDGKIDGKPIRSSTPTSKSVPFTGLSPEDLKYISDRVGGSYSGTTSQPDKQPVKGVPFTGLSPEDLKYISDRVGGSYSGKTNPKTTLSNPPKSSDNKAALEKNIKASLKQLEIDNEQLKGDALKRNIGLAADLGLDILTAVTMLTPIPGDEAAAIAVQASKAGVKTGAKTMAQQRTIDAFRTQVTDPKNLSRAQEVLSRTPAKFKKDVAIQIKVQGKTINVKANEILRNKGFKVDSYQPQGKVLSEKKRLKSPKDLVDKIPGYYDGKPAPLGFPIVEPPKMKDGMHPDLVDGKKTAKRFNRLDPISARAMPKTGNPHIDKKVKAAAKKPK